MKNEIYQGVVRDGSVVILGDATSLADGTPVLVTPLSSMRGSGAAIVAALDAAPKVPKEWVEELERLIRERDQPPSPLDPALKAWETVELP